MKDQGSTDTPPPVGRENVHFVKVGQPVEKDYRCKSNGYRWLDHTHDPETICGYGIFEERERKALLAQIRSEILRREHRRSRDLDSREIRELVGARRADLISNGNRRHRAA